MGRTTMLALVAVVTLAILTGGGCAKKVTKVQVEPAKAVEPPPSPPPSDRETFDTVSLDERARTALQTVYFDFNRADLTQRAIEGLTIAAKFLSENATVSILMEGHCDERGSSEYNVALGERRAQAVRSWLAAYGIDDKRLEATSFGKERPAIPTCTDEECHAKNRRVEFRILSR